MPDYDKSKTLFASYKKCGPAGCTFVARNFEEMQRHPNVRDNFNFVMNFFFEAISAEDEKVERYQIKPYEDSDCSVISEAINIGRRYMRTLVQADKFTDPHEEGSKGLLPIRLDILEDRLYQIKELIEHIKRARQSGDNLQLLTKLPKIYGKIQYGIIPSSVMRRSMESFFKRVNRLSTDNFSGHSYDDCLLENIESENKGGYLCDISFQIMKNPVYLVSDKRWYEESAIKEWLNKHGNLSPHRNRINPDDLCVDRAQQRRIKELDKNTPVPKSLREEFEQEYRRFSC